MLGIANLAIGLLKTGAYIPPVLISLFQDDGTTELTADDGTTILTEG